MIVKISLNNDLPSNRQFAVILIKYTFEDDGTYLKQVLLEKCWYIT